MKNCKQENIDDDTVDYNSDYFLDEAENKLLSFNDKLNKKLHNPNNNEDTLYQMNNIMSLSHFPKMYNLLSFFYILIVLCYEVHYNPYISKEQVYSRFYDAVGFTKIHVFSYFELHNIIPLFTNIVYSTFSLLGILIFISNFYYFKLILKKANFDKLEYSTLALLLLYLLLGVLSCIPDFVISINTFLPNFRETSSLLNKETGFRLIEYMFVSKILFLLSSEFIMLLIYNSNKKILRCNISDKENESIGKWANYTVIISCYIFLLFCIFMVCKGIKEGYILKESNNKSLLNNLKESDSRHNVNDRIKIFYSLSEYFISGFPYLLHILMGILVYFSSFLLSNTDLSIRIKKEENPLRKNERNEF